MTKLKIVLRGSMTGKRKEVRPIKVNKGNKIGGWRVRVDKKACRAGWARRRVPA